LRNPSEACHTLINLMPDSSIKPSLVILAAGMGSRYGGLKQIDPVGPHRELVIDYSVHDALRAGFGRVVCVIRRDIEKDFREAIGSRIEPRIDVRYVFQDKPEGRAKPWGTGHAVLAARDAVPGNFGVINADDFYGPSSYKLLAQALCEARDGAIADYAMVGFSLRNTLSKHGTVARGICTLDANGFLTGVEEVTDIASDGGAGSRTFTGDEVASMNFWGFTPSIFPHLARQFDEFQRGRGQDPKAEMYLPAAVDQLIREGRARVRVLRSPDAWFGVTYQQDRPLVVEGIQELVRGGVYPAPLWGVV
jgi:choline kinase